MRFIIYKDPTEQLNRIERKLNHMSEMETRLDEVISSVQQTVSSVVDLVGQVLAKLQSEAPQVDLSDETTTLENLQADLQQAVTNMQAVVTPPTEGVNVGEPPAEEPV